MGMCNPIADFDEFKKHVEELFGPLDELAKTDPQTYAHHVLSHGFMEYDCANKLIPKIRKQIIRERIESGDIDYKMHEEDLQKPDLQALSHGIIYKENKDKFEELQKKEYLTWAKENKIPEDLIELGWEEFCND